MMSDEEAEALRGQLLEQIENLPEEHKEKAAALKKQIKHANKEQLEQFVKAQARAQTGGHAEQGQFGGSECIFCQIIEGKIETVKIYEDADIIAILDVYPASKGHVLVMPKQHYSVIEEIPDALLNKIFVFVKAIAQSFLRVTGAKGFNLFIAQGDSAGQRVKHFCINMIPRHENDKISFEWPRIKIDKKELEKLGEKLRKEALREVESKIEAEKEKAEKKKKEEDRGEVEKITRHIKRRMP